MKKVLLVVLLLILVALSSLGQVRLREGFEDTLAIPPGWSVWNAAPFPIDPEANWTVRDTGLALPGLATARSRANSGRRAVGVSWLAGVDTITNNFLESDAWLITRRIFGSPTVTR
jgi:hypothetical protein